MSCHDYQKWVDSMSPISPEIQDHYENSMCLQVTTFGPDNDKAESCNHYLSESVKLPNREHQKHLCILPKGHNGKCKHKFTQIFKKTEQAKKLLSSLDLAN
jgi:hypothetical protein